MIQEKDASTPCDERHVNKKISNVNLSTQKKTGGKRIMGNQGTTNWKFIAFFVIGLMLTAGLIVGLLTDTAIARDGSGTASVFWSGTSGSTDTGFTAQFRSSNTLYEHLGTRDGTIPAPLAAGTTENQLMFSYRVTTNMAGGEVKFSLPAGWSIIKALADITDEKDDRADPSLDPFGRYTNSLVEVYERYGISAPTDTAVDDASASFQLVKGPAADTLTTDGEAVVPAAVAGEAASPITRARALHGRVTIDATSVLVKLSNEWRAGGEVVVVLRNVTTATPRSLSRPDGAAPFHSYPVAVKSKRSGRLDLLDPVKVDFDGDATTADDYPPQTVINVGNILGTRTDDSTADGVVHYGRDTIARDITVTPEVVYEGETDKTFKVTYTANGPMYSVLDDLVTEGRPDVDESQQASIIVTIPAELQDRTTGLTAVPLSAQNISVIARGRVQPSGNLSVGLAATDPADNPEVVIGETAVTGTPVTININRIDMGATITLTYTLRGQDTSDTGDEVAGDGIPDAASLIAVSLISVDAAARDMMVSAFEVTTTVPEADASAGITPAPAATSITGGKIHSQAGSGTMTMTAPSDNQVEAGDKISTITLQYKAATVLMDVDISVDVKGLVMTNNPDTADVTEELGGSTYGVVSYRGNFSPTQEIGEVVPGTATQDEYVTITWAGLNFTKAGQTFTIDIKNVRVRDEGGAVEFTTRVSAEGAEDFATPEADGTSADDLEKSPKLYVTNTQNDAVEFKINDQSYETFTAGQELDTDLVFSFEAVSTAIKGGQVRFTLPSGWTPMKAPSADEKVDTIGELAISGGDFQIKATATKPKTPISVSNGGRTLTLGIPQLDTTDAPVKITMKKVEHATTKIVSYVTVQAKATEADKPEKVDGYFWTSGSRGRGYNAGAVEIEISNAGDGYGGATISPSEVSAGSTDGEMTIDFTAAGTMDGGAVRLVIPDEWGDLQDDDATEANYVEVDVVQGSGSATANVADRAVIANLTGVESGSVVRFSYGGGTVDSRNGAVVQPAITTPNAPAPFIIESDGDGNGSFTNIRGMQRTKAQKDADAKADNEKPAKPLGAVYDTDAGMLFVAVTGADDGSGTAEVEIVATGSGAGMYPDDQDSDGDGNRSEVLADLMRIHAGDMGTYLKFTYTPTQTIQAGQLKFQTHGEWSAPFNSPGTAGYTEFHETGAANIGTIEFNETDNSVTVEIDSIDPDGTIEIHYGAYAGDDDGSGAHAPTSVATSSAFSISVKGGDATTNQLKPIRTLKNAPIAVRIYSQASGGGNASASVSDNKGDVGAGDADRKVTVVYTAAGQIRGGSLKLTVPGGWSHPTTDNVEITSRGTISLSSALYGGDYIGDPDVTTDDDFPVDADEVALLGAMDVTVGGVSLSAGGTVTFVYSAAMVQPGAGNASFGVAVDGGSGPGEGTAGVTPDPADATTVAVGDASPGSGSGMVAVAQAVTIGSNGNTLTFTYTPSGAITDRALDIRVQVPSGWSPPTDRVDADARGSFTVTHRKLDANKTLKLQTVAAAAVEKIGPFDRQMAARLKHGSSLAAGDQVVFTYENADAPATVGASTFVMYYGAEQVTDADLMVLVGSGKDAVALDVSVSANTILVEGDESVTVTVELQDEDGNDVPAAADQDVSLSSTPATGSFMVDGAAATMVTIMAGTSSAMADYTNSSLGAATITASSGALTAGTATVTVSTDVVKITSATVAPTVATAGDTVTVSAMGTTGKTATFSVGLIVTTDTMMEDETGSYSGSFPVVADLHGDGTYDVTVNLNGESMTLTAALTIDSTAPTVTVSDIEGTVANGDAVMISAMVEEAGSVASVMADVSMLDTEADPVMLTDADGDGTYTGSHTISDANMALNGSQMITVTAMDAAGNSGMGSTTVELLNTLSFTSTIPQGISLFHVPLDVDGLDTVGDLETMLGNSVNLLITYDGTSWNSRSDDVMITATLGILVSMAAETTVTFEGNAWADGSISLAAGSNLIGLPLNDPDVTMISDIMGLFDQGVVSSVIVASGGEFQLVAAAGDAADGPVAGDAAYLVMASAEASAVVMGDGWMNGEMAGAAPIALAGYTVDNQTPVLDLLGSVVDEITGLAKEGFRVKAKNLSTKAALSNVTSVEATEGYNMTFVDLADSYAARVGDVLEISADSPDPLLGIKPVRHIVTVDDVKNSRIQLEDLIAYEIPAETELLRNYPNPFNPETWIPYRLAEDANVSLTIYDTSGALVRSIDIGHQTAAVYETRAKAIYWDGRNRFGEQVASGIYFYSLSTGDFSATRKMVILK